MGEERFQVNFWQLMLLFTKPFFPHTPAQYNKLNERIVISSYEPLCGQVLLVVSSVFSSNMASIKKSYYFVTM